MHQMSIGKTLRIRRIMGRGRAVIVAMDHGVGSGVVPGLENPVEVVKKAAQAGADGILITPGILEQVIEHVDDLAVILRIDGCVSSLGSGPMRLFSDVEQAVTLGVDAVVLNATLGAEHESYELEKVGQVATDGRKWGLPLVAEILSQRMMANHMDMSGQGEDVLPDDISKDVRMACRIGVELGADVIKTRYSGDIEDFRDTIVSCGRPVLVAGGPRRGGGLRGALEVVGEILEAGASGVIFGRQIWQHPDPVEALEAVAAMVHEDATVEEALAGELDE